MRTTWSAIAIVRRPLGLWAPDGTGGVWSASSSSRSRSLALPLCVMPLPRSTLRLSFPFRSPRRGPSTGSCRYQSSDSGACLPQRVVGVRAAGSRLASFLNALKFPRMSLWRSKPAQSDARLRYPNGCFAPVPEFIFLAGYAFPGTESPGPAEGLLEEAPYPPSGSPRSTSRTMLFRRIPMPTPKAHL
jgi:hypothetical protein